MSVYDGLARNALGLITRKGANAVFSREDRSNIDPVTQTGAETPVTATLKAVEIPPGKSAEFRVGSLVGRKVIQLYVARYGTTFAPAEGDTVTWGGVAHKVINVTHYDPAADGAILTVAYAER